MAKAHVEGSLGRLVVELADDADNAAVLDEVRSTVASVAADISWSKAEAAPPSAPFADPGNPLAILVPLTAAALDLVAMGAAVTGWVTRLPAAPQTTRAAAALINHQPRMVSILEARLGRVGTDIALAATTAAAHGLTQSFGTPLLDLTQRTLQISEAAAHRRVWRDREPQLASPDRPQARWCRSSRRPSPRCPGTAGRPRPPVRRRTSWSAGPSTPRWTRRRARWRGRWKATSTPRPTAR
ncbi:putative cation-transporter ATPase I [Mycobacterium avium subsp. avium 2285 (R)]|nr:putative cation-transporter ATPase I [Mycobacterium avium subsp. avium 2285 (R)]